MNCLKEVKKKNYPKLSKPQENTDRQLSEIKKPIHEKKFKRKKQ